MLPGGNNPDVQSGFHIDEGRTVGALGAMAFTVGKYGLHSISNLILLVATFYLTSLLFVVFVLGAVARYNGFSILKMIRYIKEEMWLVLGILLQKPHCRH